MFKPRRIPGRRRFAAYFDQREPGRSLYSLLWREKWIDWCGSTYVPRYPAMVGRRPSYR